MAHDSWKTAGIGVSEKYCMSIGDQKTTVEKVNEEGLSSETRLIVDCRRNVAVECNTRWECEPAVSLMVCIYFIFNFSEDRTIVSRRTYSTWWWWLSKKCKSPSPGTFANITGGDGTPFHIIVFQKKKGWQLLKVLKRLSSCSLSQVTEFAELKLN